MTSDVYTAIHFFQKTICDWNSKDRSRRNSVPQSPVDICCMLLMLFLHGHLGPTKVPKYTRSQKKVTLFIFVISLSAVIRFSYFGAGTYPKEFIACHRSLIRPIGLYTRDWSQRTHSRYTLSVMAYRYEQKKSLMMPKYNESSVNSVSKCLCA